MANDTCLCIHGHFYQPPRENPWIEGIERQESAAPFHDWNERIHYECYLPNSRARVIDDRNHIVDIVNNYEAMSFNFGPTLMSWIREKHGDRIELLSPVSRLPDYYKRYVTRQNLLMVYAGNQDDMDGFAAFVLKKVR